MPGQQSDKGLFQEDQVKVLILLCVAVEEAIAAIDTIATFQAALTAKLDADTGVTDTDYASSLTEVTTMTSSNPTSANDLAALTFTVT